MWKDFKERVIYLFYMFFVVSDFCREVGGWVRFNKGCYKGSIKECLILVRFDCYRYDDVDFEELKDGFIKDEEKVILFESSFFVSGSFRFGFVLVWMFLIKYVIFYCIYVIFVCNFFEIKLR